MIEWDDPNNKVGKTVRIDTGSCQYTTWKKLAEDLGGVVDPNDGYRNTYKFTTPQAIAGETEFVWKSENKLNSVQSADYGEPEQPPGVIIAQYPQENPTNFAIYAQSADTNQYNNNKLKAPKAQIGRASCRERV